MGNLLQKTIDLFNQNQVKDFVDEVESEAEIDNRREIKKRINL